MSQEVRVRFAEPDSSPFLDIGGARSAPVQLPRCQASTTHLVFLVVPHRTDTDLQASDVWNRKKVEIK